MPKRRTYSRKNSNRKISPKRSTKQRKKVTFNATKIVSKSKQVSFRTRDGKNVNFTAKVRTPKKVKVTFYAKKSKK